VSQIRNLVQLLLLGVLLLLLPGRPAVAAPGLCVGPVCGDEITRSAKHHFQLRLRLNDQMGHHERITVDCRDESLSPSQGLIERGYARALARKACRLAEGTS
jgi:hypothetical protein